MLTSTEKIKLAAVGDIMLGDLPVCYGFGVWSAMRRHGPQFIFHKVAKFLNQFDINFGNLEAPLSHFHPLQNDFKSVQIRGDAIAVNGLKYAGFNLLNLANNHIMQHGKKALEETINLLTKNRIRFIGLGSEELNAHNFYLYSNKGLKIGFLGYNFRPLQYFLDPPLYVKGEFMRIREDILLAKNEADVVVVSLHWGDEFIERPSPLQVMLGRRIIDSGASLILGHHPHIIQGIERYKGGLIAYSLGNFVFDMWQKRLRESIILRCDLAKKGFVNFEIIPIFINDFHQPEVLRGDDGKKLVSRVTQLSVELEQENLSNFEPKVESYNLMVKQRLRQFRREVYFHYLRNLPKYNSKILISNFVGAVRKKLYEYKAASQP